MLLTLFAGFLAACPEGEVEVNGECYAETCVFDGTVCAGHGYCAGYYCLCDEGYRLSNKGCAPAECTDDMGLLCSNHGKCVTTLKGSHCVCDEGFTFVSPSCIANQCMHDGKACGGVGTCIMDDGDPRCLCDSFMGGKYCEECAENAVRFGDKCVAQECLTEQPDGEIVECGGFGVCFEYHFDKDHQATSCICYPSTILTNFQCIPFECVSEVGDQIMACSGNGICHEDRFCFCNQGFEGTVCQYAIIDCPPDKRYFEGQCITDGCLSTDGHVCGEHGDCVDDNCVCGEGFVLADGNICAPASCVVDGQFCPHGECKRADKDWKCDCKAEYQLYRGVCYPHSCIRTYDDDTQEICSNHGECDMDARKCICDINHTGTYCQKCSNVAVGIGTDCVPQTCVSYSEDGKPHVCSDHGFCKEVKYVGAPANSFYYECECEVGYYAADMGICARYGCLNDNYVFKQLCSGVGICQDNGVCKCPDDYTGKKCETHICPEGQTHVLAWGCMPDACVNRYSDGSLRVCAGFGHCVTGKKGAKCKCNADGVLVDGFCTSKACMTGKNEVCNGDGACRDGACFHKK